MGSNHDLLLKYSNNLSSKFKDEKYSSIFVGILVFAYGFIAFKLNNIAALSSTIIICLSYLFYDIILTSEFTKKVTKNIIKKLIRDKIKGGDEHQKRMEEDLAEKNKILSDENEYLKRNLKRMEHNTENLEGLKEDLRRVIKLSAKNNQDLREMKENLLSRIKSERVKNDEFIEIQLNNSKWWVFENLKGESEKMIKKVISLVNELAEKKTEASRDNRVHEKLDALKDSFDEHFTVNEWGFRKAKDDGYLVVKDHFRTRDLY